jgi:hypothetical protein
VADTVRLINTSAIFEAVRNVRIFIVVGNFMIQSSDISFELFSNGDLIRIEPLHTVNYNSALDWDMNWINTRVIVIGGAFSGHF